MAGKQELQGSNFNLHVTGDIVQYYEDNFLLVMSTVIK